MSLAPYYADEAVTLYKGDALEVLPTLTERAALVLSDPPFGQTRNVWDRVIAPAAMWAALAPLRHDRTPVLLFAQGLFAADLMVSNRREYRYDWTWDKGRTTGFLNAKKMPLRSHEQILVYYRALPTYNAQTWQGDRGHGDRMHRGPKLRTNNTYGKMREVQRDTSDTKWPRSIISIPAQHPARYPCEKPVALLAYFIATYTNPGDLVLDFCAGSGPTLEAAKLLGRRAVGVELTEKGCAIAVERLAQGVLPTEAA